MKVIRTSICSALVLCCAAAFMWTAEADTQDTDFWTEAAVSSMAEVALSNVALQKAQSDAVKQFAQQMVTDHTQANQELATAAQAKGVTIPTALPADRQRDVTKLNGVQAGNFDREYMQMMVKDHERAVKLFERQTQRGTDADAKAFAAKMLPTLQGHLTTARSLNGTLRGNRGSGNSSAGNSSDGNASNVNRSTNVRQDTNRNPNRNDNANSNTNTNTNTNGNTNTNTNTNNTNTGNTNGNTNGNAGNVNRR